VCVQELLVNTDQIYRTRKKFLHKKCSDLLWPPRQHSLVESGCYFHISPFRHVVYEFDVVCLCKMLLNSISFTCSCSSNKTFSYYHFFSNVTLTSSPFLWDLVDVKSFAEYFTEKKTRVFSMASQNKS